MTDGNDNASWTPADMRGVIESIPSNFAL